MRSVYKVCIGLLLMATTFGFSQENTQLVREITIYFESASSAISKSEAIKTEEILKNLTDLQNHSIEITAHTDSQGSTSYNTNLSTQRALAVADFFVKRGFFSRKIHYVAQGENQPVAENETQSGKAQNRRVTVKILKKSDNKLSVGGFTIKEQAYTFSNSTSQQINYPSGTIIDVPENAFVDKNGNRVIGQITMNYIEYRDPVDFILGNIPMEHQQDGQNFLFNSGGMFKITATHNGEEVFLDNDKNINIDFPLTDDLPDLNFYLFDEKTNKWVEKAKNITAKENAQEENGRVNVAQFLQIQSNAIDSVTIANRRSELSRPCYQMGQHLKMGKLFASGTDSLYTAVNLTNRDLEPYNLRRKKTVEYQLSEAKRLKKTHLIHQKTYDVKCKFSYEDDATIKFSSKTNSYLGKLNDIKWIQNNPTENYSFKSVSLLGIKKQQDNRYTITVKDSLGEKQIENLSVADYNEQKKMIVANISNQINNRQIQYKRRDELARKQELMVVKKNKELSRIKKLRYTTKDSIYRITALVDQFWNFNNSYMTDEEKKMTREEWIDYFDENKELMLNRYTEIETKDINNCLARVKEWERAERNRKVINNAEVAVRQKLSISKMGIYNCDQIYRLSEPLIVDADYSDENNNKIIPIFIYIVDKKINGILKYDGYNGYSPHHFAFSPSSETTLLAFDAEGSVYIYPKGKMKNVERSKSTHHFKLEKINTVANKEQLTALLN